MERKADDERLTYEQRAELRTRLAYPILVRFEKWLVNEYPKVMKGSPIGKAIKYTYGRFDKLSRYHLDGRYRPDNNEIENKVRPVACGRRNYLSVAIMMPLKMQRCSTRSSAAARLPGLTSARG